VLVAQICLLVLSQVLSHKTNVDTCLFSSIAGLHVPDEFLPLLFRSYAIDGGTVSSTPSIDELKCRI
jgi:hypothetical protein